MGTNAEFFHVFKKGDATKQPLLLLHGTGGNEHDLLGLANALAPDRSVISPRGRVLENGMPRFFRRFAEGKFDEEDIRLRADELSKFIASTCAANGLKAPVAIGFSNGANMAAALLVLYPALLAGAVLLRAMAPFKVLPPVDLTGRHILLSSGASDTMIPKAEADRLATHLTQSNATLTHRVLPAGHGLTQTDFTHMTEFMRTLG